MNAHDIWAAAQTTPGEGIADAVDRIQVLIDESDVNTEVKPDAHEIWALAQVVPNEGVLNAVDRVQAAIDGDEQKAAQSSRLKRATLAEVLHWVAPFN